MTSRFAVAGLIVIATAAGAGGQTRTAVERFSARVVDRVDGAAGTHLRIDVVRWPSEADRRRAVSLLDQVMRTSREEQEKALNALRELRTVGYVWTRGSLGYGLKYAHRTVAEGGEERIVVVTDRALGAWDRGGPWRLAGMGEGASLPFTVIELRPSRRGDGEGTLSIAGRIVLDGQAGTVEFAPDAAPPVLLVRVARESHAY